jgi:hypothetical protein
MAGRTSNRDRIAHLRAEADATAAEKAAAKALKDAAGPTAKKAPKARKPSVAKGTTGRSGGKVRIVWVVCDQSGKVVKQFPYAEEQQARDDARDQSAASGKTFFVKQADVRVD